MSLQGSALAGTWGCFLCDLCDLCVLMWNFIQAHDEHEDGESIVGTTEDHAVHAISQFYFVEIDEQSDGDVEKFHVGK